MDKRRVGIVTAELGIPSEVWMLRQCMGFQKIEPVLIGWRRASDGLEIPPSLETHLFSTPCPPSRTPARRIAERAGLAWARMPDARQRRDIRETLRAARLDAVLCHFAWSAIPIAMALNGALPLVAQVHGRDVSALMGRPAYCAALARTLPRLDALAAVGHFQIERLRPFGLPARHEVIPCGAPLDLFAARPVPERAPSDPVRFIAVGRLSEEKGVLESLAAFERAAAELPNAEMVFVGDGPLATRLRDAVATSSACGRVRLAGRLSAASVAEELSHAHVFVQHSLPAGGSEEGFGVTLTEAGAAGLPLVASHLGGIPDQVAEGHNGLLFAPGDVAAQAEAMCALARDEPRRRAMGEAARQVAARFDVVHMTARLEDLILETLETTREGNHG